MAKCACKLRNRETDKMSFSFIRSFLVAWIVKSLTAMQENWFQSLNWEDPLEKGMATHSSILAWRIDGQKSWQATIHGLQRVGHD